MERKQQRCRTQRIAAPEQSWLPLLGLSWPQAGHLQQCNSVLNFCSIKMIKSGTDILQKAGVKSRKKGSTQQANGVHFHKDPVTR